MLLPLAGLQGLYTLKVETAVDTILVEFYLLLLFNGSVTIASQAHVV